MKFLCFWYPWLQVLTGRKVLNEVMLLGAKVVLKQWPCLLLEEDGAWRMDQPAHWSPWLSGPADTQTHTKSETYCTVRRDVIMPWRLTRSEKDSEYVKSFLLWLFFFLLLLFVFRVFFLLLCFPRSLCSSKKLFRKIYIINTVWQYKVRRKIVVKWARFCVSACVFHISLRF